MAAGQGGPFVTEHRERVLDIVKKRYARGEISDEEYEKIKADIQ